MNRKDQFCIEILSQEMFSWTMKGI